MTDGGQQTVDYGLGSMVLGLPARPSYDFQVMSHGRNVRRDVVAVQVRPVFLIAAQSWLACLVAISTLSVVALYATKSPHPYGGWVVAGVVAVTLIPWATHQAWISLRSRIVCQPSGSCLVGLRISWSMELG